MRVGVAAVARPTFDVPFAEETARSAFRRLADVGRDLGWHLVGDATLRMDAEAVGEAVAGLAAAEPNAVVLLHASFTDSTLVQPFATLGVPIAMWAFPEDRTGGRLRLNSLCGINLAAFALKERGVRYGYLYRSVDDPAVPVELSAAVAGEPRPTRRTRVAAGPLSRDATDHATEIVARLRSTTIGLIGDHPTGFEPCAYDAARLGELGGVTVDPIPLPSLFEKAHDVSDDRAAPVHTLVGERLQGADAVDQRELDRAVRLHVALADAAAEHGWSGLAMRCWPECFTDYGSAACAAQAMLSDHGVPGCCEADVYGNLTSLVLQWLGGGPAFVADLVDLDRTSQTGVLWHCGIAPFALADPNAVATATVHSNRAKPLLHEFPLRPGRVTIARFSQAGRGHALVVGGGDVVGAPISFSGTSGVVRFDAPVDDVLAVVMGEGLEHHYGLVYGDFGDELRAVAAALDIPVIELT